MSEIVYARIDDRLIHGQVMTHWLAYVAGNQIIIVDDGVAKDAFMASVITAAAPKEIKTKVLSTADAIEQLTHDDGDGRILLLAKGPKTYCELMRGGVPLKEVCLGGLGFKPGREKLYQNITASAEERDALKELMNGGVSVYIQVVPNSERVDLANIL
ncbi:PTS system mannose/fructose/N-acetylgalactosamine-transporter subunit IIB [Thermophilibacter sp.]|uniref:PTS system mannose/fructose/N-acetylgalactosamine-transporter subunit IIB n=1 Tax=Thermophilibacter sp. TaxID=2847309 RepID=UPI003A8D7F3E